MSLRLSQFFLFCSSEIDKSAPSIDSIYLNILDGTYRAGTNINITVLFTKPVFFSVNGCPSLSLRGASTAAVYETGNGTYFIKFMYVF